MREESWCRRRVQDAADIEKRLSGPIAGAAGAAGSDEALGEFVAEVRHLVLHGKPWLSEIDDWLGARWLRAAARVLSSPLPTWHPTWRSVENRFAGL